MIILQCHSHFPIPHNNLSSSSSNSCLPSSQIKLQISPIFFFSSSNLPSTPKHSNTTCSNSTTRKSNFRDGVDPVKNNPSFFDENGAVEDMDGYLNYLSLEYDSVWDTKPSWCQPWTITLTGVGVITGSWLVLNSVVVTSLATVLIFAWWYIFLYSYPKAYTDMIAQRRDKVTSGLEDTYGSKTGQ